MKSFTVQTRAFTLLLAGACAEETSSPEPEPFVTTGADAVGPGVGGSNSALMSTGPSQGGGGSSSGSGGASTGPYPIVLAHGFFGFEDFAGVDFATYFFEVKQEFAFVGEPQVFTPAVDPFNSSTVRGAQLLAHIEQILAETGQSKVVIVAHSQGGLDARFVAHERPDLIAAVVTVATPHQGSPVADIALGIVDNPNAAGLVDDLVNAIGAPLYEQINGETSVSDALYQFSTPGIQAFNESYPDSPGVFYASLAGRTDNHLGGQACAAEFNLPLIEGWKLERDPTDTLLWLSESLLDSDNEPNDGLVRVRDAKRGEFWGCVPADHLDEIGQIFGDGPGFGNGFDHKALYLAIVAELRTRGF
jgi:triacylglycerol lipase